MENLVSHCGMTYQWHSRKKLFINGNSPELIFKGDLKMASENVKVEEAVETVTTVTEEAVKVAGPIIEQKSSKVAYIVGIGVLATAAVGVAVGIRKKIKSKKAAKNAVEAEEVMELLDSDIIDED